MNGPFWRGNCRYPLSGRRRSARNQEIGVIADRAKSSPNSSTLEYLSLTIMGLRAICQCGLTVVPLPFEPKGLFVCHCLSCRAQSSSAFGLSAFYPANSLGELPPTLKKWQRPTDSGYTIDNMFCERCGTRVLHVNSRGYIAVKGGTIEGTEKLDWSKAVHLYTRTKLPWVVIPEGAQQYEAEMPR